LDYLLRGISHKLPSNARNLLKTATQRLAAAGCDTPDLDAEVLLAHTLDKDRAWLYTHPLETLDKNHLDKFYRILHRREQREPVAYLTGQKAFFALDFQVNRHVLIPRPETELLVETAIQIVNRRTGEAASGKLSHHTQCASRPLRSDRNTYHFSIADVGTGSGCIAVALAKNIAEASFFAVDASTAALQMARQNAIHHGVAPRIHFLGGDLLQPLTRSFDLIVSNPPYVSHSELSATSPEVSQYEPRLALTGGQDGLEIIRQLLPQAKEKLKPGGSLLVEIGATQGPAVTRLAKRHFPEANVQIKKDLAGLDRLLVVEENRNNGLTN
jgi:release factor glutamine methyltransferase